MQWQLRGTPQENAIVREALDRCDFPFQDYGTAIVPVEWADLSVYGAVGASSPADSFGSETKHAKVRHHETEDGKEYDTLEVRKRVLGLAWYSGKITLEQRLVSNPLLGMEVFLSEGAHMVDFENIGGMTDRQRVAIWNAVHPPHQQLPLDTDIRDGVDLGHGHGWFDVGTYRSWVGEAWMGLFTKAFSDIPVTITFDHPATDAAAHEVRHVFLPHEEEPPVPEVPDVETDVDIEVTPEPEAEAPFFGIHGSSVYHDSHRGIRRDVTYVSRQEAEEEADRRPCRVCKPERN